MEFSNLVELYETSCAKFRERPLFGVKKGPEQWDWVTYGAVYDQITACRAGLAALGVGADDKVAIVADNRVEWAVAAYAVYGRRAQFVPMYEAQKAEEWEFILRDAGVKVVFGTKPAIVEKLRGVQKNVPSVEHLVGIDLPASDPESYEALLAKGRAAPVAAEYPKSDDIAGFIYTSGTTGMPKGVLLSHGNICSNINAVHAIFPFQPEDRSLSFLPWAHSFGQTCELHTFLSMGASMALNDEVPNLIANLAVVQPTLLLAVPRIFNRIYDGVNKQMADRPPIIQKLFHAGVAAAKKQRAGEGLGLGDNIALFLANKLIFGKVRGRFGGKLKFVISGSAALNKDVAMFIDALGIEFFEGYGLTETSPISTANWPGNRRIGSVGKPIPHVRVEIDKAVTGDPENGEIVVYGPNIMKGYHHRPEETTAVLMPDGGFRTGDMGKFDADGFLWITGRIKEQYKLENGKYVVPSPLEEELKLSPYIANAMIHGANHPYNVALIIPDVAAIQKWAADNHHTLGADLATDPKVVALIEGEIKTWGKKFKGFERPQKFVLSVDDFTTDNDMLTPTLKLKRRNVLKRYEAQLDALYKDGRAVQVAG